MQAGAGAAGISAQARLGSTPWLRGARCKEDSRRMGARLAYTPAEAPPLSRLVCVLGRHAAVHLDPGVAALLQAHVLQPLDLAHLQQTSKGMHTSEAHAAQNTNYRHMFLSRWILPTCRRKVARAW